MMLEFSIQTLILSTLYSSSLLSDCDFFGLVWLLPSRVAAICGCEKYLRGLARITEVGVDGWIS